MAPSEPPFVPVSRAVGILYVVGAPMGPLDDLTHRARRILSEVALVVAEDSALGQNLLAHHGLTTPLYTLQPPIEADDLGFLLSTLADQDVALLMPGWSVGPSQASQHLICAAVARDVRVLAVPGPAFPITALVISGLPADSFVYLDRLPPEADARQDLIESVSGEQRTLVLIDALQFLPELYDAWGDRDVALVAPMEGRIQVVWRGPLCRGARELSGRAPDRPYALVVGGAPEAARWDQDRVCQRIQVLLDQGWKAKAISQQVAADSGWPRRQVYQLALDLRKIPPDEKNPTR